ncbi:hypothetical protein EUX98_g3650 [Antrodiella citrinella]|uniref:TatD DNase family Scn1 n=1 Tax=Antrodiella citrinella TaxID=2447956 RepID=A0A4S4N455_9APHY|nr:hypothetical protein EUX98_g3650 [Antrodiella citrinella]
MMDELPIRVCAMSTRPSDQALVRDLAQRYPDKVVPAFGYHPWFSHWISTSTEPEGTQISKEAHYRSLLLSQSSSPEHRAAFDRLLPYLPDPTPLHDILTSLRADLLAFPHAMLGEVGLDRSARIPYTTPSLPPYTLHEPAHGTRKDVLSPFTIPIDHQVKVLEVQLEVAVELGRNVSVHSVKAQLATVELLERMKGRFGSQWADVSVDLHSCGLSAETWKDIEVSQTLHLNLSIAQGCCRR